MLGDPVNKLFINHCASTNLCGLPRHRQALVTRLLSALLAAVLAHCGQSFFQSPARMSYTNIKEKTRPSLLIEFASEQMQSEYQKWMITKNLKVTILEDKFRLNP